jgi:hypothetical protein
MRAILFATLTLAACANPAGPVAQSSTQDSPPVQTGALSPVAQQIRADLARLDQELRAPGVVAASIGQSADLGGGLVVRPLRVVEDSRCPNNVQCIWAGRLRLLANVSGSEVELTLGEPVPTPNGSVTLAVASPGPWAEWPTVELGEKPAYRFGFRWS